MALRMTFIIITMTIITVTITKILFLLLDSKALKFQSEA